MQVTDLEVNEWRASEHFENNGVVLLPNPLAAEAEDAQAASNWFRDKPLSTATDDDIATWFHGKPSSAKTDMWFRGEPPSSEPDQVAEWYREQAGDMSDCDEDTDVSTATMVTTFYDSLSSETTFLFANRLTCSASLLRFWQPGALFTSKVTTRSCGARSPRTTHST